MWSIRQVELVDVGLKRDGCCCDDATPTTDADDGEVERKNASSIEFQERTDSTFAAGLLDT